MELIDETQSFMKSDHDDSVMYNRNAKTLLTKSYGT